MLKFVTKEDKKAAEELSKTYETPKELEAKYKKRQKETDAKLAKYRKDDEKNRPNEVAAEDAYRNSRNVAYDELFKLEKDYDNKPADKYYTQRRNYANKMLKTADRDQFGIRSLTMGRPMSVKEWNEYSVDERYDTLMLYYGGINTMNKDIDENYAEKLKKAKEAKNRDEIKRMTDNINELKNDIQRLKRDIRILLKTDGMLEKIKKEAAKSKTKPNKEKLVEALKEAVVRLEYGDAEEAKNVILEAGFFAKLKDGAKALGEYLEDKYNDPDAAGRSIAQLDAMRRGTALNPDAGMGPSKEEYIDKIVELNKKLGRPTDGLEKELSGMSISSLLDSKDRLKKELKDKKKADKQEK